VCGGAEAFGRCTALLAVWVQSYLQHNCARHKKDLLLSKRSRPFLVAFSGEAEKVTARRVGAFASHTRAAESLFQTPQHAPNREHFVPAASFASQRTPTPPQVKTKPRTNLLTSPAPARYNVTKQTQQG
jgi:hypothetical protein